jgi:hypothetical protein
MTNVTLVLMDGDAANNALDADAALKSPAWFQSVRVDDVAGRAREQQSG